MSFFKKIKNDAAIIFFRQKKKKRPKTSKDDFDSDQENISKGATMYFKYCNNTHFGNNINLCSTTIYNENNDYTTADVKSSEDYAPTSIPNDIREKFSSIVLAEPEHFTLVSRYLKSGPKELGLKLGFDVTELEAFSPDKEGVFRLLSRWKQAETMLATVGRLLEVLWDMEEYEAVTRLAEDISACKT